MAFPADITPWRGGRINSAIQCVRPDNPSPMTYSGTNTWIIAGKPFDSATLGEHSCAFPKVPAQQATNDTIHTGNAATQSAECVVVDPAPAGEHIEAILDVCREQKLVVAAIVMTHHHIDHTEGAAELSQATGAPIYARDIEAVPGTLPLPAGTFSPFDGAPCMSIVNLPGHSPDSVGIALTSEHAIITGDVIFRHGPTVVYYPEGHLGSYLATLDNLDQLVEKDHITCFLPGHGYPITNPKESIAATREHRLERLDQIRSALASGVPAKAEDLYRVVYQETDPRLRDAAIRSIKAQLEYLGCL